MMNFRTVFTPSANVLSWIGIACLSLILATTQPALAQQSGTFNIEEMKAKGHEFFGNASQGIAESIEYVFASKGEPTAYIIGEEGGGAIVGGLRYGEGTITYKNGVSQKIFWQGPSFGLDFGGNGARTLALVYNSQSPEDLYKRFGGIEGSAFVFGGVGVTFLKNKNINIAPIRTGVGLRLGANLGYIKYAAAPTWNPF